MATKHITDNQVVQAAAYAVACGRRDPDGAICWAHELLMFWTGECEKVCLCAMERAVGRGLLEYGVSLRGAWPTAKGMALLLMPEAQLPRGGYVSAGEPVAACAKFVEDFFAFRKGGA